MEWLKEKKCVKGESIDRYPKEIGSKRFKAKEEEVKESIFEVLDKRYHRAENLPRKHK